MSLWTSKTSILSADLTELLSRSTDGHVKLAVTGLSRSGKTVFITSLIHQLLNGLEGSNLPFLQIAGSGRLQGTRMMSQPNMHIPAFGYDDAVARLFNDPPMWPESTRRISEIRLSIRYRSDNPFLKHMAPFNTLYLDIVDYPGEWLLDLPLLNTSYEQWSQQVTALCSKEPRLSLSKTWRTFMNELDVHRPSSDEILREASRLYTDFLMQAKEKYRLSVLQPGRFTMPGDLEGAPILAFCPLLSIPDEMQEGSLYETLKARYESYKEHVVKQFYREHFASFDRQIVLVDLLRTFNTGYFAFQDMREALNMVLKSFEYGKSGWLGWLLGMKIDKVLFAATKADHVTPNQLPNMERFLRQMLAEAQNNVRHDMVELNTLALASVKCTQAAYTEFQGQKISCIKGMPLKADQPVALFPGEVPADIPPPEDWVEGRFNFMEFQPPRVAQSRGGHLPHIRLDRALEFLLGDKF